MTPQEEAQGKTAPALEQSAAGPQIGRRQFLILLLAGAALIGGGAGLAGAFEQAKNIVLDSANRPILDSSGQQIKGR